jgi:hypothetical protein
MRTLHWTPSGLPLFDRGDTKDRRVVVTAGSSQAGKER